MTLKEIIDRLELWAEDIQTDISSDWISKQGIISATVQLAQIRACIANLKMIQSEGGSIALNNIQPC